MSWTVGAWLVLYLLGFIATDACQHAVDPRRDDTMRTLTDVVWPVLWVVVFVFVLVLHVDEMRRARR